MGAGWGGAVEPGVNYGAAGGGVARSRRIYRSPPAGRTAVAGGGQARRWRRREGRSRGCDRRRHNFYSEAMPLLSLWASNPEAVGQFSIEQVLATAGNGVLTDGSECARELREYLSQVPSPTLGAYVDQCLASGARKGTFTNSGLVLQDLVNELGRRLDYEVTNGRYQGVQSAVGFDGVWRSPEGHTIIAEVKTTDAYRISLDTIASYRERLLKAGDIQEPSSILIIVGRQDTGELEAQVRGSRHAWDVRLISAEALLNLVRLKESSDAPETAKKIRSLLIPREYTRLDSMIDVMFTTATDIETAASESVASEAIQPEAKVSSPASGSATSKWQFTDAELIQAKRGRIVEALSRREGKALVRKSRALYSSPDQALRAALTISKRYDARVVYWYAYHAQWDAFLTEAKRSFFVLGCMDLDYALAIPREVLAPLVPQLNKTERDGSAYSHIHLVQESGELSLVLGGGAGLIQLGEFKLPLS